MGSVVASAYAADNVAITGTTDENNPKYLGDLTFAASDSLLWKGIGSGKDEEMPVDAYVYVNDGQSYQASKIFVSGTNGDNANLNLIFGNNSSLNLTAESPLSFNKDYAINMNFYAAEGAKANFTVYAIDFRGDNALNKTAANGAIRNVYFGEGLTVNCTSFFSVEGATDTGGSMQIASDVTVAGNMSLSGANVTISETATVTVAKKSYLGGNVVIDGSYIGTGELNTSSGGGTITVNGTLQSNAWFTGGNDRPTTFLINDGGLLSVKEKFAIYSGSSITAKSGATLTAGDFVVSTGANATFENGSNVTVKSMAVGTNDTTVAGGNAVIAEGANVVSNGKTVVYEGASMTINGNLTVKNGEFLLEIDDNKDISIPNPTLTIGSKAVLNLNSLRSRNQPIKFTSGSKTYIDATEYLPEGRGALILAGNGHKIEKGALMDLKVKEGKVAAKIYGGLTVEGSLHVSGGTYFAASWNGLTLDSSDVKFTNTHLAMGDNADLLGSNIYIKKNVDLSGSALLVNKQRSESTTNILYLSENVTFNIASLGFYQQDAVNKLTINLASGSKLILEDLIFTGTIGSFDYGTLDDQDTVIINNFAEGAIAIKNYNSAIDDAVLDRIVVDGIDQLFWVKGENGYYWLSAVAVPEPAEWAMILGGLALALAIYRRRK